MNSFFPLAPLRPLLLLLLGTLAARAQGVGFGTTAPDASAALDIVSSVKGVLLPRVTSTGNVSSPATGLIVYQTNSPAGYYYNTGTPAAPVWQQLATTASGSFIQNGTTQQAGSSYNVSGNGTIGGNGTVAGTLTVGSSSPASSTLQVDGTFSLKTSPLIVGAAGSGTALAGYSYGYLQLGPANATANNFLLPDPSTCPGRLYIIRNRSDTYVANLYTAAGGLYAGSSTNATTPPYVLNFNSAPKSVLVISNGTNWMLGQLN